MRLLLVASIVASIATLVACKDSSGVDSGKLVVTLSDAEIDDLCNYVIDKQGGARTEECDDGKGGTFTVEFPDFDGCVDDLLSYLDDCTATVRQEEECSEKLGDDPCSDPNACHAADDCYPTI
jgi:hypothetical protein